MPPLNVVFDTNVFVMAAGMPGGYIDYWLYTSPAILAEVQEKLENKLQFDRRLEVEYINHLKGIATVVNPTQKLAVIANDPDDNIILECALGAQADIIVSADKDLLKLKTYEHIQIQHPTNLKYMFRYL